MEGKREGRRVVGSSGERGEFGGGKGGNERSVYGAEETDTRRRQQKRKGRTGTETGGGVRGVETTI